ncbi:hypothetical protein BCAH1134_C0182 (plasmid) [Bacillus cereus AH1134]|nr:hypothetical protein BCAH1134_C0182 [Bacillus cereus AH1134]
MLSTKVKQYKSFLRANYFLIKISLQYFTYPFHTFKHTQCNL